MIDPGLVEALASRLEAILRRTPQGLSEYELMLRLQDAPQPVFDTAVFRDSLALFRAHFLLFHTLYRLDQRLRAAGEARLAIEPLRIALEPLPEAPGTALERPDPLRAYYLDASQLPGTTREDVEAMLGRFWTRLHADDHRHEALRAFDLQEPVDFATIRRRYRELVMAHHPDRGGETATLQRINEAMAVLARLYA